MRKCNCAAPDCMFGELKKCPTVKDKNKEWMKKIMCNQCEKGKKKLGCRYNHMNDCIVVRDFNKNWMKTILCEECIDNIKPGCGYKHYSNLQIMKCKFGINCANKKCKYRH